MRALLLAAIFPLISAQADPVFRPQPPTDVGPTCRPLGPYRVTGYVRGEHSALTFDGTSVWTREPIVAASWDLPIDSLVRIADLGPTYRVADRGHLEVRHLDVLVDSRAEAYGLEALLGGPYAQVCLLGATP